MAKQTLHVRKTTENTASGSVTVNIPPDIVDKLGAVGGNQIVFVEADGEIRIESLRARCGIDE